LCSANCRRPVFFFCQRPTRVSSVDLWRLGAREGKSKGTVFWGKENVSLN
jgi:hypothetical protein